MHAGNDEKRLKKKQKREQIENLTRSNTPFSRCSSKNTVFPKTNGSFIKDIDKETLPINPELHFNNKSQVAFKHGCTNDIRKLWRQTCENQTSYRSNDANLDKTLLENDLVTNHWLIMANEKNPKKRRPIIKKRKRKKTIIMRTNAEIFDLENKK